MIPVRAPELRPEELLFADSLGRAEAVEAGREEVRVVGRRAEVMVEVPMTTIVEGVKTVVMVDPLRQKKGSILVRTARGEREKATWDGGDGASGGEGRGGGGRGRGLRGGGRGGRSSVFLIASARCGRKRLGNARGLTWRWSRS